MSKPLTREPLTKPIRVKIEKGTVEWTDGRVGAERITAYQKNAKGRDKKVGQIVRRLVCKRQEIPDVPSRAARTFEPDEPC